MQQFKAYLHSSRPRWPLPSLSPQHDPDTKKTERISRISGSVGGGGRYCKIEKYCPRRSNEPGDVQKEIILVGHSKQDAERKRNIAQCGKHKKQQAQSFSRFNLVVMINLRYAGG